MRDWIWMALCAVLIIGVGLLILWWFDRPQVVEQINFSQTIMQAAPAA